MVINEELKPAIVWFRQDLRLEDNEALNVASKEGRAIIPLYIIQDHLKLGTSSRWWIYHSICELNEELKKSGLSLIIRIGNPLDVLKEIIKETLAGSLFWNRCYEPENLKLDADIRKLSHFQDINIQSFNANLIVEPWEILNKQQKPFKVFTPFWKTWEKFDVKKPESLTKSFKFKSYFKNIHSESLMSLKLILKTEDASQLKNYWKPGASEAKQMLNRFLEEPILHYDQARDIPDLFGTSRLSPYLHFGEISPRMIWHTIMTKYRNSNASVECYLRQLAWREFAHHLLYHFPETVNVPLRKEFLDFPWKNDKVQLKAWQDGMTGYPLVDAGMRELKATGWMHNRVRMLVGSFLVKDLLIAWQYGADFFFDKLVDADLANNTLGWQWVSGCGADAAPYFRIFNPTTQAEKFDPDGNYIKKWVPELAKLPAKWIYEPFSAPEMILKIADLELGLDYPKPIVDHAKARLLALDALKQTKGYD